jgi:hypothetical protein
MAESATNVTPWTWPAEVLTFAAETGVGEYLDPMLEMTRGHFPGARSLTVYVEEDADVPDTSTILFDVRVDSLTPEQYVATSHEYVRKSFAICPAPRICLFGLRLITSDP